MKINVNWIICVLVIIWIGYYMEPTDVQVTQGGSHHHNVSSPGEQILSPTTTSAMTSRDDDDDSSNQASSDCKSPGNRTKSNQRWMKLRTTVQISSAIQKKPPLKREDSFLKRFSTRQITETQETVEDTGSEGANGEHEKSSSKRRMRYNQKRKTVVNPDENFYFYWLMVLCICVLYNLWTLIVRQSFPELQEAASMFWFTCDCLSDIVFLFDIGVQLRTGYLEQGLMVYNGKKLAYHYMRSREFTLDLATLIPLDVLQLRFGTQPLLRFPRFFKVYRSVKFYYIVESRTVWPNLWRVVNLIHILLILAHWFGCFYFLLSEAEGFQGDWVYPYRPGDYATLTRKYLGSLYWSTLTLTTIGDLPTPETNAEPSTSADGPRSLPRRGLKSRLLQFASNYGYIFTIVSYLIGVFIFATIVGQVGNVITNRNANRLEFERLLDGAKTYMRHHKVPGGMKRRVLRWYDYSWSRGRIQGGGDINTALGLLPDKLKTELALHVNLSVLKKVTIFQECQPEFLHDLVLKMKAYIFTPGDSICRKGEVAREMFIIADGILEVLSETGKVLTIMKAGDFFGEIGILNLDGLNKRTADVRSVGYSELFSLSREDVLAAMKDYPEAQEILQTLGRKRLMEVRCVNKRHAKIQSDKDNNTNTQNAQGDNSSDNSASKRIVDKLKSDVKGIKNVLKKSRTGRRSNESIELQPLHLGTTSSSSSSSKTPKGVLRRMPRVRSDELNGDGDELHHEYGEKTPSPIGAGLPLLSRLRLLKEKQDREERAAKSAPPIISPPHTHVTSAMSPQESIQEEPEPEVIGAGLPLMQRLKLLKAKEDRTKESQSNKLQVITAQTSSSSSSIVQSLSPTSPTQILGAVPATITTTLQQASIPSPMAKPSLKVSFKDRIKNLQQQQQQQPEIKPSDKLDVDVINNDMKEQLIPSNVSISKLIKPSTSVSLKEKIKLLSLPKEKEEPLKPWSKLKLATVVSSGGSYSSLNNSMNEDSPTGPTKSIIQSIQPIHIPLMKQTKQQPPPSLPLTIPSSSSTVIPIQSIRPTRVIDDININKKSKYYQLVDSTASSVSDSEIKSIDTKFRINRLKSRPLKLQQQYLQQQQQQQPTTSKAAAASIINEQKSYRSVNDLSPEYGCLPFVKKLKILNERQKLAELESVIKTRSFSLDYYKDSGNIITDLMDLTLTRSYSETSCMDKKQKQVPVQPLNITNVQQEDGQTEQPHPKEQEHEQIDEQQQQHQQKTIIIKQCLQQLSPLSPSSNDITETFERRQLKSILKRLSEDKQQQQQTSVISVTSTEGTGITTVTTTTPPDTIVKPNEQQQKRHQEGLLRAPTLEGYVARHSKFMKSVTFNNTLSSPPLSDNLCEAIEERSLFPLLSAQTIEQQQQQNLIDKPILKNVELSTNRLQGIDVSIDDDQTAIESSPTKTSFLTNQKKILKGSIEEQEYFGEVLLGIKQVIQSHLREVQGKFQERFHDLELEVKHRDEIISHLQLKIQELESQQGERNVMSRIDEVERERHGSSGTGSTGSSVELPFMRGDSLDTIFASSPPSDSGRPRSKCRSRKRNSPRHRERDLNNRSWEESSDQESMEMQDLPRSISPYRRMVVSDITGNLTRVADSVVLEMDDSSSSSTSSTESQLEEEVEEEEEEEGDAELHCDDWEIKMLAAELERRETTKKEEIGSDAVSDTDEHGGLLRRRRKKSDTDTECSEIETDSLTRPRAASLDQHRQKKPRGVFKAMSFDRDKDRL